MPRKSADWTPENLRGWRERLALTVSEAADALQLHPHSLKNLLNGRRPITDEVRARAARIERRATEPPKPKVAATRGPAGGPVHSALSPADEALLAAAEAHAAALRALVAGVIGRTATPAMYHEVNGLALAAHGLLEGASPVALRMAVAIRMTANAAAEAVVALNAERGARKAEDEKKVTLAFDGWNGDVTGPQTMTVSALGGTGGWDVRSVPLAMTGDLRQAGYGEDYSETAKKISKAAKQKS